MSAEENEAVYRRWIDAYNDRDKQAEADARAPGYVAHAPGVPEPLDSDAWAEFIFDVFAGAFPDLRLTSWTPPVIGPNDSSDSLCGGRSNHWGMRRRQGSVRKA